MALTLDEEIALLEDSIRKLKIEYDMYFGGGLKRPPFDAQWRVESTIKRLDGNRQLNFGQRFKLNSFSQKYGVFADMWRTRVKRKEEGVGPQGRRVDVAAAPEPELKQGFRVQWQDPEKDHQKVDELFNALIAAKKQVGENAESINIDGFKRFVKNKTDQLKKDMKCKNVEYVVEIENGKVSLKAKGA